MNPPRRRSIIAVYALLAGMPLAVTLGLGAIWIYLSIVPVALLAVTLFFVILGNWDAKRRGDRRLAFAIPLVTVPFLASLAGMLVALARAF